MKRDPVCGQVTAESCVGSSQMERNPRTPVPTLNTRQEQLTIRKHCNKSCTEGDDSNSTT